MTFPLIRERQPRAYTPPVYLDGPHRSRRSQNIKLLLILAIVIVTAAATRLLEDDGWDDSACSPGPHRVVDVSAQGLD